MGLNKKTVDDINVKGKRVLVRCDFNVPLKYRCSASYNQEADQRWRQGYPLLSSGQSKERPQRRRVFSSCSSKTVREAGQRGKIRC